ncbi:MAG: leucine-rich repeat domain-containing protein [Salinivirgaceae bacterium]|nr:leucine-rich repeat domain-containing protein [Salinivirgaceae bacterium]
MKKLLSFIFVTMLGGQVWAGQNYDFSSVCSSGQTLYFKITNSTEPYTVEVTYPNTLGGTYAYNEYTKPTGSVAIPESVTYEGVNYSVTRIGKSAFRKCDYLTSINIPSTVTSIGYEAFKGCTNLSIVTISNSIIEIGIDEFSDCKKLNYNKYDKAYYLGNDENPYIALIKVESTEITSCDINDNCFVIGDNAFKDCSGLTSITIPNTVKRIGNLAFYNCCNLTSATIPSTISSVGTFAFQDCNNLDYNTYNNAYYLGNGDCSYVILIAAKRDDIESCIIHSNCRAVYSRAFFNCTNLKSVSIPNSVVEIGDDAFYNCGALEKVEFESIESFCRIKYLSSYSNPMEWYHHLIIKGKEVTDLTIPETVPIIDNGAFGYCHFLTSVTITNDVNVTKSGLYFTKDDIKYRLLDKNTVSVISFDNSNFVNVVIPDVVVAGNIFEVTSINAFSYCSNLTTVIIPNSIKSIGSNSFQYCTSLTSVDIPHSVTTIGNNVFSDCNNLASVSIGSLLQR